ncbi:MAG: carboxypeptidase regulatory-like domain-containing protein, partial [Acidobacteria bacterium]|nr:carboxypeptidase regulatory-like domain-containing protein [Acidobacteriota bacterium]
MNWKRSHRALAVVALSLAALKLFASPAPEAVSSALGTITGKVTNSRGIAQAGVSINLVHQTRRFAQQVLTEGNGRFRVEGLPPGTYALEVILPSFLPFFKSPILVRSGAEVLMDISLRSLSDSMEVRWPEDSRAVREEWGWILRNGSPPRPLLRFQTTPGDPFPAVPDEQERALHGTLQLWAGNESLGFGRPPGLHTTFGMEYGAGSNNAVEVSGSAGWEQNTPGAGFRVAWTRWSGDTDSSTLSATVRQLFLTPDYWRSMSLVPSSSDGRLQSVTAVYENESSLGPKLRLQYGTALDVMNAGQKTSRWSPFGRIIYAASQNGRLTLEYTAVAPRSLPSRGALAHQVTEQWLAIPQMSNGPDSTLALEGGSHIESAWEQQVNSALRFQVGAFYDALSATAFALAGTDGSQWMAGLLRDPFSNLYYLSGGSFSGTGVRTAVGLKLSENTEFIAGYSYASGLQTSSDSLVIESPAASALLGFVQPRLGHSWSLKLRSTLPGVGTQVVTSYRWVPRNTVVAPDLYNRDLGDSDPYLNIVLM